MTFRTTAQLRSNSKLRGRSEIIFNVSNTRSVFIFQRLL